MATPVTNTQDWSSIYAAVQQTAQVPSTAETTRDGSRLIVRDLVVSLDTVIQAVESAPSPPLVAYVFADVVTLSATRNWALPPMALFIVARRVVATSGTFLQLDYRTNPNSTIVVFANEIEGPLSVHAVTSTNPRVPAIFDLTQFDSIGVQISLSGDQAVQTPVPALPPELLAVGSSLWMSLSTSFEFAAILIESQPDIARAILAWLQAACAPSALVADVSLQSAALLAQLTVTASDVHFVPYLSPSVYESTAAAFGDAAKQYESQYQFFSAQNAAKDQWIAAAQNMEKYFALTADFNRELIAQAQANLEGASDAVHEATLRYQLTQLTIDPLRAKFEAGIEKWKDDETLAAVFQILVAIVTFGAAIAEIAVGDPAAAGAADGAAASAGVAAANAAKAGGEAAKVAGTMSELAGAMDGLKKAAKALAATYEVIQKIVEASSAVQSSNGYSDPIPGVDDISTQAEWDIFRMKVDRMMQFPVDQGIDGAADYREALDELTIYAKALAATQASLVRTAQELARLQLQARVSAGMTQTIDDSIARMQQSEKPDQLAMHLFFARGMAVRRWLFIAIRNYTWSYRYWALRPSSVTPSITASASDLVDDLAEMQRDYADALEAFQAPPQSFGTENGGLEVEITDPRVLADLRTKGETQFVVDTSRPEFAAFDRVRLSRLRVWLYGANGGAYVQIRTSGVYDDRLAGTGFKFTAAPLERFFQYQGAPGDASGIVGGGVVDDEDRFAYFQPTPFTNWQLRVPPSLNDGLDLTGLSKVTMTFAGSAIGTMTGSAR
jgi:hypothetical protein